MRVVGDLRKFEDAEIIVIDDGSSREHTSLLVRRLYGVNEFVLHANDLYDVVVLNRAIGFARGKYVAIIQDDDGYNDKAWVTRAVTFLNNRPRLAILGGRDRVTVSKGGKPVVGPRKGIFQYAQIINAAPMWVRRNTFLELGGFDMDFSPMLWHEGALCLKAWLSGYHVGWYESMVKTSTVKTSGRRNAGKYLRSAASKKNYRLLMEKFGDKLGDIERIMREIGK